MDEPEIICGGAPMFNPRHTDPRWTEKHDFLDGTVLEASPRVLYQVQRSPLHDAWICRCVMFPPEGRAAREEHIQADLPGQTYLHPSREMAMVACERHLKEHP
jgi:hypothetical protein